MLAKLEAPKGNASSDDAKVVQKQRRKFAELAVPGLCLALLCVIYCVVYLTNTGKDIAHGQQMREYLGKLRDFDSTAHAVFTEMQSRAHYLIGKDRPFDVDRHYRSTNARIHNLLQLKSSSEWRLRGKIEDHRLDTKRYCLPEQVMRDVLFYSEFLSDLKQLILAHVSRFQQMHTWKTYYEFETHVRHYCDIKLNLIAISFFQELEDRANELECSFMSETMFGYVSQFGVLFDQLHDANGYKPFETFTSSALLSKTLEALINGSISTIKDSQWVKFSQYYQHLKHGEQTTSQKQAQCYRKIEETNSRGFHLGIFYFVVIFLCTGGTGLCVYAFAHILKYESRVVVGVSDWLNSVTVELDEQKTSTDEVLEKVVPKVVKTSYDLGNTTSNMIPYHSSEATLLMCSIAQFDKFFTMFTAGQTLHILTLVMELLDERMEEYNVFPVTRMGSCQVVLSDSVQRRKFQHACEIANLALDIMTCCSDLEIGKQSVSKLQMKIGIHSGPNCGMLIVRGGVLRFQITGMSCAILQKVHKTALPNRTQVSDATYKLLSVCETYSLHMRGNIKVKGLPQLKVYGLDGRRVSSSNTDGDSVCSKIGSWIEFERKPLYRLDEEEGTYEPLNKCRSRRYSQMSMESYNFPNACRSDANSSSS